MIRNYLKITLRSLWKSKIFVTINVLGMGMAMACCIVAYLNYNYNISYDIQHKNAENIYRVDFLRDFQGSVTKNGIAPQPLANTIRGRISGLKNVVSYVPEYANIRIRGELFGTSLSYADADFLEMFTFPLVSGSKEDFKDKSKIFISSQLAQKYFGNEEAVGKQITHVLDSGTLEYIVGGVFEKIPPNSSFQFEAITLMANYYDTFKDEKDDDWSRWNVLFLEVPTQGNVASVEAELQKYKVIQNKAREDFRVTSFFLEPFKGMAVRAVKEKIHNHWFRNSLPTPAVIAPGIMAFLILLIVICNFINTSIAMSGRRLKEIGIRKVMGSNKQQLIFQFMAENIILCLIAAVVALLVAELLVPAYNEMWDFLELDLNYLTNIRFLLFMFGLLLITGLVAGSYPAFYISKFEATSILKGTFKFGGTNLFTRSLLGIQYSICLITLISAVAFIQNAKYQEQIDLGFNEKGILYTDINGEKEYETYKNVLSGNKDIIAITGTKHHIMSTFYNDPIKYESTEREVDILEVSEGYMDIMDMKLLEGRNFKKDSETDRKESVIINQTMAQYFGLDDPMGARLIWKDTVQLFVVGVFKDYYNNGLWDVIEPTMLRLNNPEEYSRILIKADTKNLKAVNEDMEAKWKEVFPNRIYSAEFMDADMKAANSINGNILKLFLFLGIIATLLSASGLFSMVSLNIIKRMKEIGVRKVLGASVLNIATRLNMWFAIILLIAAVIGSFASYFFIDSLMSSIWTYYTRTNALTFLSGILVMIVVSVLTVGYKTYEAAAMNPVNTLRNE